MMQRFLDEARQVAELLSQLPSEMDVIQLVSQAFSQAEAQADMEAAAAGGVARRWGWAGLRGR